MRWDVTADFDVFDVIKKLEQAWRADLAIVLFGDGSGHLTDLYHRAMYVDWETWDEFIKTMQELNEDPDAVARLRGQIQPRG